MTDRLPHARRLHGVYLVTDHAPGLVERVAEAIAGGVGTVQFRSKEHTPAQRAALGLELRQLCRQTGTLFIVNDDVALARELAADGVHLGQDDGDAEAARQLLGPDRLVGISTHDLAEALAAQAAGADYIGFGAMYPTGSKEIRHLAGPSLLAGVRPHVSIPIVAIGGIDRDNAGPVIDAGADAVAVIAAVMGHPEPALAAAELRCLFNRGQEWPRGSVLTVAGSDSGGGAGIQADLKTITLLGAYGASVVTALTAQNTRGVTGIHAAPAEFVAAQLEAVLSDIPVDVVKTGMLFCAPIITIVAQKLREYGRRLVVVDPVMVAKGGANLVDESAVAAFREELLPLTYLLTPNLPEAEALTGLSIGDEAGMAAAARALHAMGARNVLLKGGHLPGDEAVDLFFDGRKLQRLTAPRFATTNTHGTGCSTASAVAAFLARGEPLPVAVARAKEFITTAIRLARPLGHGHGPVNHFAAARELFSKE
jgi:hydroxymethylpyrimidine kinase/phosphomethylpyrimidine kinase/thiamine-phosphate diphosphorylase